jgi:hypothetical protein
MDPIPTSRQARWTLFILIVWLSLPARAGDTVGAYLGAAIGRGWVETGDRTFPDITGPVAFKESHTAYKVMVGVRPISPRPG